VINETGTIQWFKNGNPITGAVDTVYTTFESGNYSASVQNSKGCGQSDVVSVNVDGLPVIITPSGSLNFCVGDSVTLSSSESGTFQWYNNNLPIAGATNASYTAKATGDYWVRVQNAKGCGRSSDAYVNVNAERPSVTWDGTVLRTNSSNYQYQWYLDGDAIAGATSNILYPPQLGIYKVVIADYTCKNTSDEFHLDCNAIAVPRPSVNWNGTQLVTAQGFTNYQWYLNGDTIPGAHNVSFQPIQTGNYKVTVIGKFSCQNTSNEFAFNCSLAGPSKPPINWDGTKFSTTAGYAHYQWYQNDTAINGATANSYTPGTSQFGKYKVVVTNNFNCSSTSDAEPYSFTAVTNIVIGDARLTCYPNPAKAVLNIDLSNMRNAKLVAELYDQTGRLIRKQLLNQVHNQLSVQQLPFGLYQLVIYNGSVERAALKVIVTK
jgi:hypothetical protein